LNHCRSSSKACNALIVGRVALHGGCVISLQSFDHFPAIADSPESVRVNLIGVTKAIPASTTNTDPKILSSIFFLPFNLQLRVPLYVSHS
jgi:hypothetical protein